MSSPPRGRHPRLALLAAAAAASVAMVVPVVDPPAGEPALAAAGAPAGPVGAAARPAAADAGCTVDLGPSTWTFVPCLAPGRPLPADVVRTLA
ncbi:MAG TPA: hypothetical protein VE547_03540, partial [Mycobacteriales bacterium]|nr:hypothetical protein [Mycobacteriales bacterium]